MKPILFSAPMVRAILEGRKTMTRRVVGEDKRGEWAAVNDVRENSETGASVPCYLLREVSIDDKSRNIMYPKYDIGDFLWVRETWCYNNFGLHYRADWPDDNCPDMESEDKWRPSIFMPREAARIFLRVTDVRAERVQNITEEDAVKEGVPCDWPMDAVYCRQCHGDGLVGAVHPVTLGYMDIDCPYCKKAEIRFRNLWDSLNAKRGYGWDTSPWVWVYTFERCEKPQEDA